MAIMAGGGLKIDRFPIEIDIRPFKVNSDLIHASTFRLARQLGDMRVPLTRSIRDVVTVSMIKNYIMGGRPRWTPLAKSTLERRTKSGQFRIMPLMDTEKMARISTSMAIWKVDRTSADMESLDRVVPYAKFHQQGTKDMPQRQFALLQLRDVEEIVIIFDNWIRGMTGARDFWPYWDDGSSNGSGEFV